MKVMVAVDDFMQNLYAHFASSVGPEDSIAAQSFYESVIRRADDSPVFRERLLSDPKGVLAGAGIVLPEGIEVHLIENTNDTVHIVIPPYIGE